MVLRELVFTQEDSCDEFFVTCEMLEMMGKSEEEILYVKRLTFQFYREDFTNRTSLTNDIMVFETVKRRIKKNFAAGLIVLQATVQAVNLKYEGGNMKHFMNTAEIFNEEAELGDETNYGQIKESIGNNMEMIKLTVPSKAKNVPDNQESVDTRFKTISQKLYRTIFNQSDRAPAKI